MSEVALKLSELSVTEKIQFGRQIVTAMTANANFTTPNPLLATLTTAINLLETNFNAKAAADEVAKQKTILVHQSDAALDLLITAEGNYVQNISNGDAIKIESAGMTIKGAKTPSAMPVQVTDLGVTRGDNSGEVDLHWQSIANAKSYVIQTSIDPFTDATWQIIMTVTKSKAEILNQQVGQRRWYRVAAVGAAGQGAWSQPVIIVIGN